MTSIELGNKLNQLTKEDGNLEVIQALLHRVRALRQTTREIVHCTKLLEGRMDLIRVLLASNAGEFSDQQRFDTVENLFAGRHSDGPSRRGDCTVTV